MPECLDDFVAETNPVRVVDVFVDELDLLKLVFVRVEPKDRFKEAPDKQISP